MQYDSIALQDTGFFVQKGKTDQTWGGGIGASFDVTYGFPHFIVWAGYAAADGISVVDFHLKP